VTTVQQNVDSALEGIVRLDTTYRTLFNLMSGNELERPTTRSITPALLCIENIVLVHDAIDPFVKIHVTDLRLANIIIKNTMSVRPTSTDSMLRIMILLAKSYNSAYRTTPNRIVDKSRGLQW